MGESRDFRQHRIAQRAARLLHAALQRLPGAGDDAHLDEPLQDPLKAGMFECSLAWHLLILHNREVQFTRGIAMFNGS